MEQEVNMEIPKTMSINPILVPTRETRNHPHFPWLSVPMRLSRRRLPGADYRHPDCACLITTCTHDRIPLFSRSCFASVAQSALLERASRDNFTLMAYTIMPDHVHLVIAPGASGLSISNITGRWKGYVACCLREMALRESPWQRNFHDRILRTDEKSPGGLARMIAYVLENPVRKGLVSYWKDYPYSGCYVDIGGDEPRLSNGPG
jgi:REP element-mobilizing transposase RayT